MVPLRVGQQNPVNINCLHFGYREQARLLTGGRGARGTGFGFGRGGVTTTGTTAFGAAFGGGGGGTTTLQQSNTTPPGFGGQQSPVNPNLAQAGLALHAAVGTASTQGTTTIPIIILIITIQ